MSDSSFSPATMRWLRYFVYLVVPLSGVGIDIYTPSLPAMVQHFSSTRAMVQFTLVLYVLGFGIGQPIAGVLTDHFGRRLILRCGLALQVIALFGVILTPWVDGVIVWRLLQGLAVSFVVVPARAILADVFTGDAFRRAVTNMTVAWSAGPIVAPWLGGHLQHWFNWQASFIFLLCYTAVVFILVLVWLPETHFHRTKYTVASALKQYGSLFSHRYFVCGVLFLGVLTTFMLVFNMVVPFIIQRELGYSALVSGRVALLAGLAFFLGNLSNRFLTRLSVNARIGLGLTIIVFSDLVLYVLGRYLALSLLTLVLPMLLLIAMSGLILPNQVARCMALFPRSAGMANAGLFGCCWLIGSLATSLATNLRVSSLVPLSYLNAGLIAVAVLLYFAVIRRWCEAPA